MTFKFQDIPLAGDLISQSQGDLKANFDYLQASLGKDHQIVFGDTNMTTFEGRHTQVSLKDRANTNIPIPIDGVDSFFWSSGGDVWGRNTTSSALQLTGLTYSAANANPGFFFLPGGMKLAFGTVTPVVNQSLTVVSYAKTFSSATFVVIITASRTDSPQNSDSIYVNAKSASGFSYFATTTSTGFASFDYVAIGA